MNNYLNISAYKFIDLDYLPVLQADMHTFLEKQTVLGTVLLADEGINVALAGQEDDVQRCIDWYAKDERFADLDFKHSRSESLPFSKLKVKIRREIIGFGQDGIDPLHNPAPGISALELKKWLDEGRDFVLLDTRNEYEIESGTFRQAVSLKINNFRDFGQAVKNSGEFTDSKPIVTFCTGGVRCEKAAPWMLANGYSNVLQVEGGILRYLEECGDAHWKGNCFVFDDRVELDSTLKETGATLCKNCHNAVSRSDQQSPAYIPGTSCPQCQSL